MTLRKGLKEFFLYFSVLVLKTGYHHVWRRIIGGIFLNANYFGEKLKEPFVYLTVGHHLDFATVNSSIEAFELGLNEPIHIKETKNHICTNNKRQTIRIQLFPSTSFSRIVMWYWHLVWIGQFFGSTGSEQLED